MVGIETQLQPNELEVYELPRPTIRLIDSRPKFTRKSPVE